MRERRSRGGTPWQWRLGKALNAYMIFMAVFGALIFAVGLVMVIVDGI